MGTIQSILTQLCDSIAATGAAIRLAYDKIPISDPPCRYMTGAVTAVQLASPSDYAGGSLYPLKLQLEFHLLAPAEDTPGMLYDRLEQQLMTPILDSGYTVMQLRAEAPQIQPWLNKMELTAQVTLLCRYQRKEGTA
ncbi:hypothetical protein [Ruminococcus champanellensis]|uniref:hypothetical protein n=1 Tax=Ruminococcus champanellensis TaxID=1161942 RepID=UPI00248BE4A7|nr:hypothetical protein [Ruminococcus champanellensis]